MRGPVDRMAAFVEDLVRNRRPCRFKASPEEMDALGAAAELAAARPGADLPSGDFIARLGRQLRSQMEPPPAHEPVTRRALLRTAGLAAAAGVAGAVIDRTIVSQPLGQQATLMPDHGTWRPVAALADVSAGQSVRFSSGPVEGVVVNDGGRGDNKGGVRGLHPPGLPPPSGRGCAPPSLSLPSDGLLGNRPADLILTGDAAGQLAGFASPRPRRPDRGAGRLSLPLYLDSYRYLS